MARILPEYEHVLGQEMGQAVFQALGFASVCWTESPSGVFESEQAKQVGDELMGIIVQYAQLYPCEHTADGQRMRHG
jgi:hypothetical protein